MAIELLRETVTRKRRVASQCLKQHTSKRIHVRCPPTETRRRTRDTLSR
jgi:hypothetical protein